MTGIQRRLALFSINYWPEPTGIAPYTTAFAQHLVERGWAVDVLTGMPYYPRWRVDEKYDGRSSSHTTRRGVHLHRIRPWVPGRQSAVRRLGFESSFVVRSALRARLPRPDAVIAVTPNLGAGLLGAAFARRHGVRFGLIVQDLVGNAAGQSGMPGGDFAARPVRWTEGLLARRADAVVVASEGYRPHLESLGISPARTTHIPNWSHLGAPTRSREETRRCLGWAPDETIVLHAGNIGLKQGLDHVITTARAAAATHPCLRFVLLGDGNQRRRLEAASRGLPNVTFIAPVGEHEFANVLQAADLLLVSERGSVIDMAIPSKLTAYFAAGRPVIASVVAGGITAREVERSGAGVVVPAGETGALLDAIARLGHDVAAREQMSRAGKAFAGTHLRAEESLARLETFARSLLP